MGCSFPGAASSLPGQTPEKRKMGEVVFGCVPVLHICCVYGWVLVRERGVGGRLAMRTCVPVSLSTSP